MKKGYKLAFALGMTSVMLLTACEGDKALKSDKVVNVDKKSYTEKNLKDSAEIDLTGRLNVGEGVLSKALDTYYNDIDEKQFETALKANIETIEKSSKQKLSDETVKAKTKAFKKSYQMDLLYQDFIKLDNKKLEEEFLAGYYVKQGLYTKAIGEDADKSEKALQNFKKDVKKIKNSDDLVSVIEKYAKDESLAVGSFTVTKDMSIFDTDKETTGKIMKADKGDLIVFNNSEDKSVKNDNYIYITDSWKATQSQVIQYKKAQYIKENLGTTVDILKAIESKHKSFKIDKDFMKKLVEEQEGKYLVKTNAEELSTKGTYTEDSKSEKESN